MKFKVGDKVKIVNGINHIDNGFVSRIERIGPDEDCYPIILHDEPPSGDNYFCDEELKPLESLSEETRPGCGELILMPEDAQERKDTPIWSGFMKYFPNAIIAVSQHSLRSNEQHNPGQPLKWDKSKSSDEKDSMGRHWLEGDHVSVAWRAMANLEREIEKGYRP